MLLIVKLCSPTTQTGNQPAFSSFAETPIRCLIYAILHPLHRCQYLKVLEVVLPHEPQ